MFKTSQEITYLDLFKRNNIKSTIVCLSSQIWNQLKGFNAMMYYIVYIFKMIGYSGNSELTSSSIQYVIFFGVTLISLPLTEKIGRTRLMLIGGILMMCWLFIVSSLFAIYSNPFESLLSETISISIPHAPSKRILVKLSLHVPIYMLLHSEVPGQWSVGFTC